MAAANDSALRHLVECPVCLEHDGVPKMLPCEHTVCSDCIDSLPICDGCVDCPMCRKNVFISNSIESLPTNRTLMQVRDIIDKAEKQGQSNSCKCCGETGKSVTHLCKDCEEQFCETCAGKHILKMLFNYHRPVAIDGIVCKEHGRPFTFFCLDCNKLLCFVCYNRDICEDHRIEELEDLQDEKQAALKEIIQKISGNVEANKREIQPAKEAAIHGLESVQQVKVDIQEYGTKLKRQIDMDVKALVEEADQYENRLQTIKEQLEADDQLDSLCKLKTTADDAYSKGIEHILLTLPTLQMALIPELTPVSHKAFKTLVFTPHDIVSVGKLQEKMCIFPTTNINSERIWEKGNIGITLWDVVLMPTGRLAFTDIGVGKVILMERECDMQADHTKIVHSLKQPRSIAYHPIEDVLLVCDLSGGHVVFLSPIDLHERKQLKMPGISHPVGICVLSDGSLVVSGSRQVGVFDINGTQLHLWDNYNNGTEQFGWPWYVAVDHYDNILVSDWPRKKIIKLDKTGQLLCEWSTEGLPCSVTVAGDTVLVAQRQPDCVLAYDLQGGDAKQIVIWQGRSEKQFSRIMSLSFQHNELCVVGVKGLKIYKLTNK